MKFETNKCIAIHVSDLAAAERFYSGVLNLSLLSKTDTYLEYQTGHFLLYINKDSVARGPIPSFTVKNASDAKELLKNSGCKIIDDRNTSLYFSDPFGNVYDVVEE